MESGNGIKSEALDLNDCVDEETFSKLEEESERKEILGSLLDFSGAEQFKQLYAPFLKGGMSYGTLAPFGEFSHMVLENLQ